ncbi:MAG: hypothetical protein HY744_19845 [Deltaproteobacteria bacterium]|nr:hypothetical protein [Deltaproteobacteria bacterium]
MGARDVAQALPLVLAIGLVACGCGRLSPEECENLREQAFEIANGAHTCDSDADCFGSDWPACTKPASGKKLAKIDALAQRFKQGKCVEPPAQCRKPPEIYCKQGLCTFRELAGGK